VRNRGSALGVLWSFANPTLMTALYTGSCSERRSLATTTVRRAGMCSPHSSASLSRLCSCRRRGEALVSIVANGGLLNKIALDPEIFPIAATGANIFQQAVTTFPVILLLSALLTHDPICVVLVAVVLATVVAMCAGFRLGGSGAVSVLPRSVVSLRFGGLFLLADQPNILSRGAGYPEFGRGSWSIR
jgi:hypothetical protein